MHWVLGNFSKAKKFLNVNTRQTAVINYINVFEQSSGNLKKF